jgi:CheY-like chemotaxis protein
MGKKTILVVDDEQNVRLLVSKVLNKDYVILEAGDGEEAVATARSKIPDMILMDIMMPNMDGYSACSAIKGDPATKAIPVVMVTALHQSMNEILATTLGADGYIVKPFNAAELLSTVDRFCKSQG